MKTLAEIKTRTKHSLGIFAYIRMVIDVLLIAIAAGVYGIVVRFGDAAEKSHSFSLTNPTSTPSLSAGRQSR
jgi:hypothetical protein